MFLLQRTVVKKFKDIDFDKVIKYYIVSLNLSSSVKCNFFGA